MCECDCRRLKCLDSKYKTNNKILSSRNTKQSQIIFGESYSNIVATPYVFSVFTITYSQFISFGYTKIIAICISKGSSVLRVVDDITISCFMMMKWGRERLHMTDQGFLQQLLGVGF
jgi:hypothetical protein